VEHDARGSAVWVRTRATDKEELPELSLTIEPSTRGRPRGGPPKAQASYYDTAGAASEPRRKPKDLRALSRWIEARKNVASDTDDE